MTIGRLFSLATLNHKVQRLEQLLFIRDAQLLVDGIVLVPHVVHLPECLNRDTIGVQSKKLADVFLELDQFSIVRHDERSCFLSLEKKEIVR